MLQPVSKRLVVTSQLFIQKISLKTQPISQTNSKLEYRLHSIFLMDHIYLASFKRAYFVILINLFTIQAFSFQCFNVFSTENVITIDGSRFNFTEIISSSGQSTLYRLSEGFVLRTFNSANPQLSTQRFLEGYEILKSNGLKNIASIERSGPQWVIQEQVQVVMTLRDFLFQMESMKNNGHPDFQTMFDKFLEFSVQTTKFEDIGDFHSGQLVWNGQEWILIDWDHETEMATPQSPYTFNLGTEAPSQLARQLLDQSTALILRARREQ